MIPSAPVPVGRPRKAQLPRLASIPGTLIVRFAPRPVRAAAPEPAHLAAAAMALPAAVADPLDWLRRNAGLREVVPLFAGKAPRAAAAPAHRLAAAASVLQAEEEALAGFAVVRLDPKRPVGAVLRKLEGAKGIVLAEPMPARWVQAEADPLLNRQWGLRAIRWFQARRPVAKAVTVAVIDTGVDQDHPDLTGVVRAYHHPGLKAADVVGHGTHVSGIVAALVDNQQGIAGVARTRLEVWKVFPDEPEQGDFYVDGERYLKALNAVRRSGARVLNLSLGGTERSETEAILFRQLDVAGVVVAAAMGNAGDEGNPTMYPAAYPGVMAVGAVAESLRRASFSNTGRHIGISAPGVNVLSTLPTRAAPPYRRETEYAAWSGTSMATPHVAGAAALVLARNPAWTAKQVKERLRATAAKVAGMRGRAWTPSYGDGLLDLEKAL
ncbi:MAG TPA: S8 family serine peptidase [Anaeromyxobacteraceae bacterium]|nr:S8 family serine peptidase [Anaeromyxobacteraceae bacterium]